MALAVAHHPGHDHRPLIAVLPIVRIAEGLWRWWRVKRHPGTPADLLVEFVKSALTGLSCHTRPSSGRAYGSRGWRPAGNGNPWKHW
jgi:hypothetical protein